MSHIRNCLTLTASAAAGLFLASLASSATAAADAAPVAPGLSGIVDQMVATSTSLPQQLLQSTASALTGTPLTPAASPAQPPIATATLNVPQTSAAGAPATGAPAGIPGLPGLQLPANLSSVLPFPLPNFGGVTPAAGIPGAFLPSAPIAPTVPVLPSAPIDVQLIPGLP